jgi:hypothetical protein
MVPSAVSRCSYAWHHWKYTIGFVCAVWIGVLAFITYQGVSG